MMATFLKTARSSAPSGVTVSNDNIVSKRISVEDRRSSSEGVTFEADGDRSAAMNPSRTQTRLLGKIHNKIKQQRSLTAFMDSEVDPRPYTLHPTPYTLYPSP
jgi:hypothetical protein